MTDTHLPTDTLVIAPEAPVLRRKTRKVTGQRIDKFELPAGYTRTALIKGKINSRTTVLMRFEHDTEPVRFYRWHFPKGKLVPVDRDEFVNSAVTILSH